MTRALQASLILLLISAFGVFGASTSFAAELGPAPAGNSWLVYVIAGLLTLGILVASFAPAKRDFHD